MLDLILVFTRAHSIDEHARVCTFRCAAIGLAITVDVDRFALRERMPDCRDTEGRQMYNPHECAGNDYCADTVPYSWPR